MAQGVLTPTSGQIQTFNARMPAEGPKAIPLTFDFSQYPSYEVDFTLAQMQQRLSVVQSVWVDNSANPEPVSLNVSMSGQIIVCPAYSQGVFPCIAALRPKIIVSCSGTSIIVCVFMNVPLPANVWTVETPPTTQTAAIANNTKITTGGTAVTVFAVDTVNGGFITNPNDATESLFVDCFTTAGTVSPGASGTTIELVPGQSFVIPTGLSNAVTANAVTSGH